MDHKVSLYYQHVIDIDSRVPVLQRGWFSFCIMTHFKSCTDYTHIATLGESR